MVFFCSGEQWEHKPSETTSETRNSSLNEGFGTSSTPADEQAFISDRKMPIRAARNCTIKESVLNESLKSFPT